MNYEKAIIPTELSGLVYYNRKIAESSIGLGDWSLYLHCDFLNDEIDYINGYMLLPYGPTVHRTIINDTYALGNISAGNFTTLASGFTVTGGTSIIDEFDIDFELIRPTDSSSTSVLLSFTCPYATETMFLIFDWHCSRKTTT